MLRLKKKVRAEDIGQLELELVTERQVGRYGSCSTEYVRDVRPGRPEMCAFAFIAICNVSFILRLFGGV